MLDNLLIYNESVSKVSSVQASRLRIYPNPAKEFIRVDAQLFENIKLELYSLNGLKLKTVNQHKMDISSFENGTYLLKVYRGNDFRVSPIIISK